MIQRLVSTEWTFIAACKFFAWRMRQKLKRCRTRPGERVAKRRRCQTKVGSNHKINQAESIKWFKNRFEGIVR